jgi:serine-type D-Ala-D-Ala carboxypeptidase/endopeptidase (penicillin-binding protein 4)
MMKKIYPLIFLLFPFLLSAQITEKITSAMKEFNNDEQLKYALTSFYVIDATSGATIFDQNSTIGVAPASTEKIITAATAFDVLGSAFTYETKFGIINTAKGKSLYIQTSGDPTLGSWRWETTKEQVILDKLKAAIKSAGISKLESIIINPGNWENQTYPEAWIWQDLGNYFGADAQCLNWRENQYDLTLKSGDKIGAPVSIIKSNPVLYDYKIVSKATAAEKESGDNTYIFYPAFGNNYGLLTGTIPVGKSSFTVSGSFIVPLNQFSKTVANSLKDVVRFSTDKYVLSLKPENKVEWIYTHTSPALSAIAYWFLRKSINLYGESFLKTIASYKTGTGSTESGIEFEHQYWKERGIDPEELHLYDGSGLSPQNRVTTHAQVMILKYAKSQSWFKDYYEAFPTYNEMKMKSGTINRVKGYAGYQKSIAGKEYIFSLLINNYNGSEYSLIRKMYKVLDHLK